VVEMITKSATHSHCYFNEHISAHTTTENCTKKQSVIK